MAEQAATLEILIQIRDELAGLNRTRDGIKETKKEALSLGAIIKSGLGVGTGMEIARRGLNLLSQSFKESIGGAFRLAEQVKDQSEALNLTTEAYQVLRFELAQAGVDQARMTMAISAQVQSLADARTGAGAAAEAYKTLGLRAADIEQLRPEERLAAVARATFNATDKTKAFQAAGQMLGQRGLPQLLNSLRNLADNGYDRVAAAARASGQIMADETIEMLDKAKKRVDNFRATTLPIAAGTAIGWVQKAMDSAGAGAANFLNNMQGLPTSNYTVAPTPKLTVPAPTGPIYADTEKVLAARVAASETHAGFVQNAPLLTELEKRKALLPVLREQEQLYKKLIEVKFGDTAKDLPADGNVTEEELTRYKERNELESKLVGIRQQRMDAVDTPLLALGRSMADVTSYTQQTLAGGISTALDNLTSDLVAAGNRTKSWGDAFRGLGLTAASVLQQILARMIIIQTINAALGLFGFKLGGDSGGIVKVAPTDVKMAGGGSFMTRGPTNLTVGDNPGGMELVSVTPISGIGRTTVNGHAARMAGGGQLVTGNLGGGDTFNFAYSFHGGVSRQEVLGLIPSIVEASKGAVLEAKRRGRDGFR